MIVADTNLIASLWVPNDMSEIASAVLESDPDWIAPLLWKSEFRNVLSKYLWHDLLDFSKIINVIEDAEYMMSQKSFDINSFQVMDLVEKSTCTSYDCEFVALAQDLNIPLVTFDKRILSEFPDLAISPQNFISFNAK